MTARENLMRAIRREEPEWLPYRYDGTLKILRSNVLRVRPVKGGLDDWGVNWLYTNEEEGSYQDGKAILDLEDMAGFRVPDTDFAAVAADLKAQADALAGQDVVTVAYNELVLLERVQLLLGVEGFWCGFLEYPDEMDDLIQQVFEYNCKLVDALLDTGVDGVRFTDDWGMQDRLFISPEHWRKFFKERYRVLYRKVKERGKLVFHHSCGCVGSIMEDIIELGVDVLDPVQPAANDIYLYKKRYGDRLTFMGGLDTQTYLSFATAEEVYDKVSEVISVMAKGGGYIAAPSHTITIPQANREAMFRAIKDYNQRHRDGGEE